MSTMPQVRVVWGRLCRSVLGASACALGAAVLDAAWARAAAGEGRGTAGVSIYLADLGLIAPVAIAVGLAAGLAGFVVDPAAPPSPRSLVAAIRVRAIGNRASAAAFVPLAVLGAFFWTTLERPPGAGAARRGGPPRPRRRGHRRRGHRARPARRPRHPRAHAPAAPYARHRERGAARVRRPRLHRRRGPRRGRSRSSPSGSPPGRSPATAASSASMASSSGPSSICARPPSSSRSCSAGSSPPR